MTHNYKLSLGKASEGGELVLEETTTHGIDSAEKYINATRHDGGWIIFNTQHSYMYDYEYAILLSESESYKTLPGGKPITAASTVDVKEGGLCVFRGHHFFDKNWTYTETEADIADKFRPQTNDGVSSCIIFEPNPWEMTYLAADGTTKTVVAKPGRYDAMEKLGFPTDTLVKALKLSE